MLGSTVSPRVLFVATCLLLLLGSSCHHSAGAVPSVGREESAADATTATTSCDAPQSSSDTNTNATSSTTWWSISDGDEGDSDAPYSKSITRQVLDYYARPGDGGILRTPLPHVRAAWDGPTLMTTPEEWTTELTREESGELSRSVKKAAARLRGEGRNWESARGDDIDFPPSILKLMEKLRVELGGVHGLGLHLLRNIPVDDWSADESRFFFLALGRLVGITGAQDEDGSLLHDVRDTGENPETGRKYATRGHIHAHADAADVVGLLCLEEGRKGGVSRIVSSVSVYNEFLARHGSASPAMVERLYRPFPMDLRGNKAQLSYLPLVPLRYAGDGELRTFYTTDYFKSAYDHPDAGHMSDFDQNVLRAYDDIANDASLYLDMTFRRGDVQLLSNHVVLHGRTAFQDHDADEAKGRKKKKRHLLRMWLSLDTITARESYRTYVSRKADYVAVLSRIVWAKARGALGIKGGTTGATAAREE